MVNKQNEIESIVNTMMQHNITVEEISKHFHQVFKEDSPFDLLCVQNGEFKRVSFDIGKELKPVGIFPDKDSPYYLYLNKFLGRRSSLKLDESKIPSVDFFKMLFAKRQLLQKAFAELGIHDLNGTYLVNYKVYPAKEWHIVGFYCQNIGMSSCYIGEKDEYIRVRYFGTFTD
ncbi:MAG: hypothetical protein IJV97_05790 [Alphaproteobacteria bacterium]|nr:hypothetical protein [Alphaproteobacteria bacterium]